MALLGESLDGACSSVGGAVGDGEHGDHDDGIHDTIEAADAGVADGDDYSPKSAYIVLYEFEKRGRRPGGERRCSISTGRKRTEWRRSRVNRRVAEETWVSVRH